MTTPTGAVMLLSATSEPLGHVDFPKAMRMLFRKVAEVVDGDPTRMVGPHRWPRIIRLLRKIVETWVDRPAHWHRGGVYIRDRHRCAYCGKKGTTLDHILPRSRGGMWEWTNIVSACPSCNWFKADRTPEEAGMRLVYATPHVPTLAELRDKAKAGPAYAG